ncbi:MAG: trypsin-like peptidase domain-containing protein [Patescibacteria group bacterium]
MENLTKTQLILLVLLVSFITSLVTGIVSVTLVNQAPAQMTQTINRVIEKVITEKPQSGNQTAAVMTNYEELITKLVEETLPAVASIIASKDVPVIERYFVDPWKNDDFFRQFVPLELMPELQVPQFRQKGTQNQQISSGTGFFVSSDGFLITNKHVVEDPEADYTVLMNDGRKLKAKVLARDSVQDVAILKIEGSNFSFIKLGDSDKIKIGQTVIAIGNVLGEFQNTVSVGVISGLRRSIIASGAASGPELLPEVIQTDAAINRGNSGGPLLDLAGRAIGINTAVAAGAENVGFTLPINSIKKAIADVKEFGKISHAFLGVRYQIITPEVKAEKKLATDYGALLIAGDSGEAVVFKDSPAEKAGLKAGDIILEFDGKRINQDNTLAKILSQKSAGQKVKLKVFKDGRESIIELELAEQPSNS